MSSAKDNQAIQASEKDGSSGSEDSDFVDEVLGLLAMYSDQTFLGISESEAFLERLINASK